MNHLADLVTATTSDGDTSYPVMCCADCSSCTVHRINSTPRIFALAAVLAVALLTATCSTLEIQDGYALPDKSLEIHLTIPDGDLTLGIEPATRLYAFGMLGAPVIPTVAHAQAAKELNLAVTMVLHANHDFSFMRLPCMRIDALNRICADRVLADATASRQDDGSAHSDKQPRWQMLPAFANPSRQYHIEIPADFGSTDIDRSAIYRLYRYSGTPLWTLLNVELHYHFTCPAECPQTFSLDGTGLVRIDHAPAPLSTLTFHRTKLRGYSPLTPVQ